MGYIWWQFPQNTLSETKIWNLHPLAKLWAPPPFHIQSLPSSRLYPLRLLQFSRPFSCLCWSITMSSRVVILYFVLHSSVHSMEWRFLSWLVLLSQWGTLWNTFQFTSWWSKTHSAVKGDNITSSTEKDLAPSRLTFLEGISRFIPSFLIS